MSDRPSQAADLEPLVVKPKVAWKMLGCGNTRGYELLAAGELKAIRTAVRAKLRSSASKDLSQGSLLAPIRGIPGR